MERITIPATLNRRKSTDDESQTQSKSQPDKPFDLAAHKRQYDDGVRHRRLQRVQEIRQKRIEKLIPDDVLGFDFLSLLRHPNLSSNQRAATNLAQSYTNNGYLHEDGKQLENLFIEGPTGTGKSMLAYQILRQRILDGVKADCVKWRNLVLAIRQSYKPNQPTDALTTSQIIEKYSTVDFLMFDDLGVGGKVEADHNDIAFAILDNRFEKGLPTVITTNLSLEGIEQNFSPELAGRINKKCGYLLVEGLNHRQ